MSARTLLYTSTTRLAGRLDLSVPFASSFASKPELRLHANRHALEVARICWQRLFKMESCRSTTVYQGSRLKTRLCLQERLCSEARNIKDAKTLRKSSRAICTSLAYFLCFVRVSKTLAFSCVYIGTAVYYRSRVRNAFSSTSRIVSRHAYRARSNKALLNPKGATINPIVYQTLPLGIDILLRVPAYACFVCLSITFKVTAE